METTLIFRDGLELPDFASFVLLDDPEGLEALRGYYAAYVAIAKRHGVGIVLDTPTWRANLDWGARLGYSAEALDDVNRRGVALLTDMRAEGGDGVVMVISGCIGPRGDGYVVGEAMSPDEAQAYHSAQVSTFAGTDADLVSALTLNYADEATGIARAAVDAGIPSVISFTVETDGRLPSGQELRDAVAEVDAATGAGPAYYMVNCAHPTHFEDVLSAGGLDTGPRPAGQRLDEKPRRARRGRGARPGGSGRPRRPLPRAQAAAPGPQRRRRMLRHRRAPHRDDLRGVQLASR